MADAGRHDLDQHLADLWPFDVDRFDGERLAGLPGHRGAGLHGCPPGKYYGCQAASFDFGWSVALSRAASITLNTARSTSLTPWPDADDSTNGVFLHAFLSLAVCALIASGVSASAFDSTTISGLSVRQI